MYNNDRQESQILGGKIERHLLNSQAREKFTKKPVSVSTATEKKMGLGFPLCRLVGIACQVSGVLLNAAVGHCRSILMLMISFWVILILRRIFLLQQFRRKAQIF